MSHLALLPFRRQRQRASKTTRLFIEWLEDRLTPASSFADFGSLQLIPGSYDPHSIIVRFQLNVDVQSQINQSILPGATGKSLLSWMPSMESVTLPNNVDVQTALATYNASPFVVYAEPNYELHVNTTIPNDPNFGQMWNLQNTGQNGGTAGADIGATRAWDVSTGSGSTIVAVIDTGVDYTHPDLAANMWTNPGEIPGDGKDNDHNGYVDDVHGYDFANNDGDPMDDNGHGTHVAGTIGAVGNNDLGVTGINWHVKIMALKFLDANGSGSSAAAIEAINYAVDNGATISNNSWGGDPPSQAMYDAINSARAAGHIFVTAAGNGNELGIGQNNDTSPFYPSNYDLDNIISVAATDSTDNLAMFSNYGQNTVDLAAPGVDILSTLPGGQYGKASGTSMATPHVTGVVALVRDLHPDWTYQQVIHQVLSTVDQLPQLNGVTISGGRLDAGAALGNPETPPPPPLTVNLPVVDDFNDNQAQGFVPQIGNWAAANGTYDVRVVADDNNLEGISTVNLASFVPENFEVQTTINADEGYVEALGLVIHNNLTNGYVIFDYHSRTDYKFAGLDMDQDRVVIGHRDSLGWHTDTFVGKTLNPSTNYQFDMKVENNHTVTVTVDGGSTVSYTYSDTLNDGQVGLGMRDSTTHFDNTAVVDDTPPTPTTLPFSEDFSDGLAQNFQRQSGFATVTAGRFEFTPFVGQDGIETIDFSDPLPSNLDLQAIINANNASNGYLSNAFIIFDYQSPTDFKFAGTYAGTDQWLIGHRTSTDWVADATLNVPIDGLTDYNLRVVIQNSHSVILYADGVPMISYVYADSLTDGQVGLGTRSAISRFDDVSVKEFVPPAVSSLPMSEDFQDGVADFFDPRAGEWSVSNGRYAVTPLGGQNAVSTLLLSQPLPTNLNFDATINVDPGSSSYRSNGLIIFDYQSANDFKFAGAYAGTGQWVIGHWDGANWTNDTTIDATINTLTDYNLRLAIANDTTATLYVGGLPQVSYDFGGSLTDGKLGVGTSNGISRFDNVQVTEVPPTQPPTAGSLPLSENFDDGVADNFEVQLGEWSVTSGKYEVTPLPNQDGISTLLLSQALPANLDMSATINANGAASGYLSNAFLIFDYQSPTDFKFAGAYAGSDQWIIGHRTTSGWVVDASLDSTIDAATDYNVRVVIENDSLVTLYVGGVPYLSYNYGQSLTDGLVGVGTRNAVSRFDNVVVQQYAPPPSSALPFSEAFQDGTANYFDPRSGDWTVTSGRYAVTPIGGQDGISTLLLNQPLPTSLQFDVTVNVDPASSNLLSNGTIIFDYQSPTDFKFAGAFAGTNQWVIGHRDSSGWITDVTLSATINTFTDYNLELLIQNDSKATLFVNGLPEVSHTYADSLTDGNLGLGTQNAISRFDNVIVQEYTPPAPPTAGSLPLSEDFNDGTDDHFERNSGFWSITNGQYQVTPVVGEDGISTVVLSGTLPSNLEMNVTINANDTSSGYLSNALLIFDYQSSTDFKFAGAYAGADQWIIGHRDASGWHVDAFQDGPIDALTDYHLRLTIENNTLVSLYVNDAFQVDYTFASSVTGGQVGLGTQQAISRFDDFQVQEYSPPASTTLPAQEDFQDGVADFFDVRIGTWNVTNGRYEVTPAVGEDGISTMRISQTLPDAVEFLATINASVGTVDYLSNAFLIFDYHGPTDFKFAGAYAGSNQWLVGHRDASGWVTDAWIGGSINANTDYNLRLVITNLTDVVLYVDGVPLVSHHYANAVNDGKLGLGTKNAVSRFDDVLVQQYTAPAEATIPYSENFDDGVADYFQIQSGTWTLSSGRFGVTPDAGQDGISTLLTSDPLPTNLDLQVLMNANPSSSTYLSNGFLIFDYHSPTDFKFAGAYVGSNQWIIGHRDASGWQVDAANGSTINALTDYNLRVIVENGTDVSLFVNGGYQVSFTYANYVTNGEVGLGTRNSITRFDNFVVQPFTHTGAQVQSSDFLIVPSLQDNPTIIADLAQLWQQDDTSLRDGPLVTKTVLDHLFSQLDGSENDVGSGAGNSFAPASFLDTQREEFLFALAQLLAADQKQLI